MTQAARTAPPATWFTNQQTPAFGPRYPSGQREGAVAVWLLPEKTARDRVPRVGQAHLGASGGMHACTHVRMC